MQSHNSLVLQNIDVLSQGLDVLNRPDDEVFTHVRQPFSRYGIASHFRHCLDFIPS